MAAPVRTGLVEGWSRPPLAIAEISFIASPKRSLLGAFGSVMSHLRIDREAIAQGFDPQPHFGFERAVALLAAAREAVKHIGDHVADFTELGRAEAARGAGR